MSKCTVETFKYVELPGGAASQFVQNGGRYGQDDAPEDDDLDYIDPDSEEAKNPYFEKFLIGDLNIMFKEEDEVLDEELVKLNQ